MLLTEQNELLTRVGRGTPMGTLMRRYWIPALLSWEVPEPDSPPVEVRLLGEDLVAFRDTSGSIGMVDAYCAHRRASLFWGRNEENGLRCVYHGWKFDRTGVCVDMPSEPDDSNFKDKVKIPAYPTFEAGGLIYVYMGPPEKQPPPPLFEWNQVAEDHRGLSKIWQPCNWLQALEGGIDTVHSAFLHGGRPPGLKYDDSARGRALNRSKASILEVIPTDYGYCYGGLRDYSDTQYHVRGYHWVMPWNQLRAGSVDADMPTVSGHMWIPIDDYNTMVYNWTYTYGGEPLPERLRRLVGTGNELYVDIDVANNFRSMRNRENKYMIDREKQKRETYTGIIGTNTQDRAIQESMGGILDRSLERLGTTDRAIIAARRYLLQAVKTVDEGGDPPAVAPTYYKARAIEGIVDKDKDWFDELRPRLYQLEELQPLLAQ